MLLAVRLVWTAVGAGLWHGLMLAASHKTSAQKSHSKLFAVHFMPPLIGTLRLGPSGVEHLLCVGIRPGGPPLSSSPKVPMSPPCIRLVYFRSLYTLLCSIYALKSLS